MLIFSFLVRDLLADRLGHWGLGCGCCVSVVAVVVFLLLFWSSEEEEEGRGGE